MNFLLHTAPDLLARLLLVCMFPLSAYDKIVHWREAMAQEETEPLPCPEALMVVAIAIEALTPLCIVFGWHDRLAAFILAGFCVVTAILFHPFWKYPHFWRDAGDGRQHFWDFFKNLCLAGGLGLLVISASPLGLGQVATHPLSNAPYSAPPSP